MTTTLIVPGLNSSGSAHWQTWFESQIPDAIRVIQADWKRANLPEWSGRIRREISRRSGPIVIAAHSFGALAAVQAAEDLSHRVAGALLVAPADPEKFAITDMLPAGPLGFPATIVASSNDPWLSIERALSLAVRWGANLIDLGDAGHINAESGYGPWPFGLALLAQLVTESAQPGWVRPVGSALSVPDGSRLGQARASPRLKCRVERRPLPERCAGLRTVAENASKRCGLRISGIYYTRNT